MSYFEEMDDVEFGARLFESEMGTEMDENELHVNRCIKKGRRAKQLKTNNIIWHRNRDCYHHSWPGDKIASNRRNAQVRRDNIKLNHDAVRTNTEDYDEVDVCPPQLRRY